VVIAKGGQSIKAVHTDLFHIFDWGRGKVQGVGQGVQSGQHQSTIGLGIDGAQMGPSDIGAQHPADVELIGDMFVEVDHQVIVFLTEVDVPSGISAHGTGSALVVALFLYKGIGVQGYPALHVQPIGELIFDGHIPESPASGIVLVVLIYDPIGVVYGSPHEGIHVGSGIEIGLLEFIDAHVHGPVFPHGSNHVLGIGAGLITGTVPTQGVGQDIVRTSPNGQFVGDVKIKVDGNVVPFQVTVGHDAVLVESGIGNPIGRTFPSSGHGNTCCRGDRGLEEINEFALGGHPRGGLHKIRGALVKGIPLIDQEIGIEGSPVGTVGRGRGDPVRGPVAINVGIHEKAVPAASVYRTVAGTVFILEVGPGGFVDPTGGHAGIDGHGGLLFGPGT